MTERRGAAPEVCGTGQGSCPAGVTLQARKDFSIFETVLAVAGSSLGGEVGDEAVVS